MFSPEGNDVWGWTDPINNDEYAIMGLTAATTFVRITDPRNPVPVGVLYTEWDNSIVQCFNLDLQLPHSQHL